MSDTGPALIELASRKVHRLEGAEQFLVGRSRDANVPVVDVTCSRRQFQIMYEEGQHFVEPLSQYSPTLCDGQPIDEKTPLRSGAVLRVGQMEFQFVAAGQSLDSLPYAPQPTMVGPTVDEEDIAPVPEKFPVRDEMLIGRDTGRVQICLPHVRVSRVHARIKLQGKGAVFVDLKSANGTYVNGKRQIMPGLLEPGDRIGIGPYNLQFTGEALVSTSRENNVHLAGINLRRVVAAHPADAPRAARDEISSDPSKVILDDVTLVARPREFICVLGPSGSGKTTLLEMLSARKPVDGGRVLLNQQDLHAQFDSLKQDLSVVQQRDILHDLLSVKDALYYTARLRLPPDTTAGEVDDIVRQVLQTVGLSDRQNVAIERLSGGQRKRASLANELIADPSLLFLDEVTSGLDEQADRSMMRLFREIAESGKTVLCITHSLAAVESSCNLVVVLTQEGKLAFVGPPWEALEYFGLDRLGDIYDRLSDHTPDYWKDKFASSPQRARYVSSRLPADLPSTDTEKPVPEITLSKVRERFWHQFPLLARRYLQVLVADRPSIAGMLGQIIWVVLLLAVVFGDVQQTTATDPTLQAAEQAAQTCQLLFLIGLSCFWFGCNNAAKEIVREWPIFQKERQVNLDLLSYFASKFVVQNVFSMVQATAVFFLVAFFCHLPGQFLSQWFFMLALAASGAAVGLLISAASRSEAFAVTMVPMAMIPQIVLSSVFGKLEGVAKLGGQMAVTCYWGYGALRGLLDDNLVAQLPVPEISPMLAAAVIALHVGLLVGATLLVLDCRGDQDWKRRLAFRWRTITGLFGSKAASDEE